MAAWLEYKSCDIVSVLKFEFWRFEKHLIPYAREIVLPNVLIKDLIIELYKFRLT